METRVVHSIELRIGSGLPGTQGKKDDSGSYINGIRQREIDQDSPRSSEVTRSRECQGNLPGSRSASSRGAEGCSEQCLDNVPTADTVSRPVYEDMTLHSEGGVSQSLPPKLGSLQESQHCLRHSSSCRHLPVAHCALGTVLGSGGDSGGPE